MNEEQLLELKGQIEDAKKEVNELQGRKKYLSQQLEKEYKVKTLPQAKKKLEKWKEELRILQEQINAGIVDLVEEYNLEGEDAK